MLQTCSKPDEANKFLTVRSIYNWKENSSAARSYAKEMELTEL